MGGWVDEWMGGWVDGWMGGWMGRWEDGWMDGWAVGVAQAPDTGPAHHTYLSYKYKVPLQAPYKKLLVMSIFPVSNGPQQ